MTIVQKLSPALSDRSPPCSSPPCSCARSGAALASRRAAVAKMVRRIGSLSTRVFIRQSGPSAGMTPRRAYRSCSADLLLDHERHHDGEEGGALDERGENDPGGLDRAGDLGLA